jgi:hypothetical protein
MEDKKKIAAAISAVCHHIKIEAEAIHKHETMPRRHQPISGITKAPTTAFNLWRNSGRQAQMQMRTLMQMRMFQTSRLE